MKKMIEVTHENGYRGVLYGESSMSIFYGDEQRLHTGSRNINTEEELYETLEQMPEFEKAIMKMRESIDE